MEALKFTILKLANTVSTNDDARQAAEKGADAGTVIWALSQTSGRGRQGREWASPEGNLYCSIILRPNGGAQAYGFYSFITALAIVDTVRSFLPDALIELKWPNDVLVGGKKISGILLEAGQGFLIVGIGINTLHYPENPLYPVTSLAAEIADVPYLETVLDKLLAALSDWCATFEQEGFEPVRQAWLQQARKGVMNARLPKGDMRGTFADLDARGNLRLSLADGSEQSISAGDVFF